MFLLDRLPQVISAISPQKIEIFFKNFVFLTESEEVLGLYLSKREGKKGGPDEAGPDRRRTFLSYQTVGEANSRSSKSDFANVNEIGNRLHWH